MLQLEKFCYYQHLSLSGGQERPIFSCRIVDIRGTRFHVLSRIQDAGLDFTGRTNFIAHHLVFTPEEIRQFPTPPIILHDWPGWVKLWTKEPKLLENEDWAALTALAGKTNVPAQTWQRVTGDAVNGYGLLETRAGTSFRVDDQTDETVLELIAESLELLEVRDTRRDFRSGAWNYTFTTSMQEQDNPADFRWRCIHSDNPAANRFTTPDCRALSAVRATKWTGEETAFARSGRQAPQFVAEPQDSRITEGESVHFTAKAEGIPNPNYQWFSVDRANNGQVLPGETKPELVVSNPALGISRYVVNVANSAGNSQSRVATVSVEKKLKLAQVKSDAGTRTAAKGVSYQKTEEEIERQRRRLEAEKAQEFFKKRRLRNQILVSILAIIFISVASVYAWKRFVRNLSPEEPKRASSEGGQTNRDLPPTPTVVTAQQNPQNPTRSDDNQTKRIESNLESEPMTISLPESSFKLPHGWMPMVVGTVTNILAEYINVSSQHRFDLSATAAGFFTNGDNILFVCKTNKGKEFKATLLKIDVPMVQNRCGIMIRDSQMSNSPFLFIGTSSDKVFTYCRDAKGVFFADEVDIPKTVEGFPIILKFSPKDNQFVPAYSFDSKNWSSFSGDYVISSSTQTLVGFAICSGSAYERVTAQFFDVSPNK